MPIEARFSDTFNAIARRVMSVFDDRTHTASLLAIQSRANGQGDVLLEDVAKDETVLLGGTTPDVPLRFRIHSLEGAYLVDKNSSVVEKGGTPQVFLRLTDIGTAAIEGFRRYAAIMIPARARLAREDVLRQDNGQD